jgi:hypothetical protein
MSLVEADSVLENGTRVFVLEYENEVYVFPQNILVWHEIVNLVDSRLALTYCPLTGSAITYEYPDDLETTLGTSGSLINSNLLMYDRTTGTFISQIDGTALDNQLQGLELKTIPTFWATWEQVKAAYTDALVLSTDTGYFRDYKKDPYGSYTADSLSNYYTNRSLFFPINNTDTRETFHEKYSIIGVKQDDKQLAIDKARVKSSGSIEFDFNGQTFMATYDESIDSVRITNNDVNLSNPTYFEVMWFAWYAFYPETEVMK